MIKVIISDYFHVLLIPRQKGEGLSEVESRLIAEGAGKGEDYGILNYMELNKELLDLFAQKKDEMPCYIFTSATMNDKSLLVTHLKQSVKEIYSAPVDIGIHKSDPQAYKKLTEKIGIKPEEALFIDDSKPNTRAARKAGLMVHTFTENQELFDLIRFM